MKILVIGDYCIDEFIYCECNNPREFEIIKTLKKKHAVNLSGAFKIFLKELLEKLEK